MCPKWILSAQHGTWLAARLSYVLQHISIQSSRPGESPAPSPMTANSKSPMPDKPSSSKASVWYGTASQSADQPPHLQLPPRLRELESCVLILCLLVCLLLCRMLSSLIKVICSQQPAHVIWHMSTDMPKGCIQVKVISSPGRCICHSALRHRCTKFADAAGLLQC